jgi:uncharacterized membrane protein YhaH (DUF805 family)
MPFGGAVRVCLRKYADFSGRASRSEYWWFILFTLIVATIAASLDASGGVLVVAWLALVIPSLAVGVRRLHDTERSGWWLLIYFIPLVGWLVLLVFLASRGDSGPNRYGAPPSAASPSETAVPVAPASDPPPERARIPSEGLAALRVPDPDAEIVKRLDGGQVVVVIERREGWARVREADGEAWWIDGRRLV